MTPVEWAVVWVAVVVGACVQGSAGFGLAVVAAPILAFIDPVFVPGPMLTMAVVLCVGILIRERAALELGGLGWALVGRVPGTLVGAWTVLVLSDRWLGVAMGLLVLAAVAMSVARPIFKPTPAALMGAGLAGGFMGTTSSIGGPPMALVYQSRRGPELRAVLSAYFVLGALMSLASLVVVGAFGAPEARASAALLPALLAGLVVSRPLARVLDRRHTRLAVLGVSGLAAVLLLGRNML